MPIETITIDTEQWAVVPMELLSELAESLACELDARYPACNRAYPSQERKYQSAMEPVFKSRALLLTQQPEHSFCSQCKGECGRTVEEYYDDRIIEVHWVDCEHCSGTGEEPKSAAAPESNQVWLRTQERKKRYADQARKS